MKRKPKLTAAHLGRLLRRLDAALARTPWTWYVHPKRVIHHNNGWVEIKTAGGSWWWTEETFGRLRELGEELSVETERPTRPEKETR